MQISNLTPRYENGEMTSVTIYFSGKVGGISFNGPITLNAEEALPFIKMAEMESAVKQKDIDIIINGDGEEDAE